MAAEAVAMEGGSKDASSSLQEEDTGDGRDAKVIETEMDVEVEVLPIEQA